MLRVHCPADAEAAIAFKLPVPVERGQGGHVDRYAQRCIRYRPVYRLAAPGVAPVERTCDLSARIKTEFGRNLLPGLADNISRIRTENLGKLIREEGKTLIDVHLPGKPYGAPARLKDESIVVFRCLRRKVFVRIGQVFLVLARVTGNVRSVII